MYEKIKELYSTDQLLLDVYHISAPASPEVCAMRTTKDLELAKVDVNWLYNNEELIGYYGIDSKFNMLVGFFIKPEHRNKQTINNMLLDVYSKLDSSKNIYTCIYVKNDRAAKFLSKIGTVAGSSAYGITFKLDREKLQCH